MSTSTQPERTKLDRGVDDESTDSDAAVGRVIGRYTVLGVLGSGGMGTVYAAHDAELDRPVALKILHPEPADGSRQTKARSRLLREARALAKVSDPNVIHVYDVGVVQENGEEQVFVAMELVAGGDLRAWLAELQATDRWAEGNAWREIVGVMRQAARGLRAAHAVKLMHRDFKPDNVLVGDDGVVRVVDFGLARRVGALARPEPTLKDATSVDARLTQTGAVLGTPAYMAPEQFRGGTTDARTDQFSFCATLYEALVGRRPFSSDSGAALAVAVMEGDMRPWPPTPKVPPHLAALVERGLSLHPGDRFASIDALLVALDYDPAAVRRRRIRWGLGALVVAGSVGLGAGLVGSTDEDVCGFGEARVEKIWNDARRDAVRAGLDVPGAVFAQRTAARSTDALDAYAAQWAQAHRRACEATQVAKVQTDTLLDKRMLCLERRLTRLDAAAAELAEADITVLRNAPGLVAGLPALERCDDLEAIAASLPPPPTEIADRVAEVRATIERAKAKTVVHRYSAARDQFESLRAEIKALDYAPLHAEFGGSLADLEYLMGNIDAAHDAAREAWKLAQSIGHDEAAAYAARRLTVIVGIARAKPTEGLVWADVAEATSRRASLGPRDEVEQLRARAFVLVEYDLADDAVEVAERATRLARESFGNDDPLVGSASSTLGAVLGRLRRYEAAEAAFREAVRLTEFELGEEHPSLIKQYRNLGNTLAAQHKLDESRHVLERSLEIADNTPDIAPGDKATGLASLGNLLLQERRYEDAEARLSKAVELRREEFGDDHPLVSRALMSHGNALTNLARMDDAARAYADAIAIRERAHGLEHPSLVLPLLNAGMNFVRHGAPEDALAPLQRAEALFASGKGVDEEWRRAEGGYWLGRARAETEDDPADGLAQVDAALAALEEAGVEGLARDGKAWRTGFRR